MGFIVYSLHLTFGLLVLNEFAPFSHTAYLEATLEDRGLYGCLYTNVNKPKMFVMTLHQLHAGVLDAFLIYLQFLLRSLEAVITRTFMSL